MTTRELPELLPCPFCPDGGSPKIIVDTNDDGRFAAVACDTCGCGSRQHYFLGEDAREHAASAWNTRAAQRVSEGMADEFEALVRALPPSQSPGEVAWPERCDWPKGKRFAVWDMAGEHEPCYLVLPGGEMLPFVHHATNGIDQARAEFIARACNDELRVIEQRDEYYDLIEQFSDAVASHLGIDIGEHSSANWPWQNALDALRDAHPAPDAAGDAWIPVGERLPEKEGCYLCVIRQEGSKSKGYVSLARYGSYEFYCEDDSPRLKPGESFNEGVVTGHGWHNEEDSHGGEYDTYIVTYRAGSSQGAVSHWMPRPELPAALQSDAALNPGAGEGES